MFRIIFVYFSCLNWQQIMVKQISFFLQEQNQDNTLIKIILSMQQTHQSEIYSPYPRTPRKLSDSPLTDHTNSHSPKVSILTLSLPHDLRMNLYEKAVDQFAISQKMNRRGINWLLTLSWSKGFEQPCIWGAILLFYAYKNNVPFSKEELQPIIIVCLQLSSKLHESRALETRDLLMALSHPVSRDKIIEYEQKILQLIEFNLIIPHYMASIWEVVDNDQDAYKVYFICELFALSTHSIFFDKWKIEKIINFITKGKDLQFEEQDIYEITQMLGDKQSRILYNKYSNKFDVDAFLHLFNFSY